MIMNYCYLATINGYQFKEHVNINQDSNSFVTIFQLEGIMQVNTSSRTPALQSCKE